MDFSDPQGTVELTKVLLKEYYNVEWDIPVGQLVPPVPCRAKYLIWMHDLLQLMKPSPGTDLQIRCPQARPVMHCREESCWVGCWLRGQLYLSFVGHFDVWLAFCGK